MVQSARLELFNSKMALERPAKRYGFELSRSGSCPEVKKSWGGEREVSATACHREARGGGGITKGTLDSPALNIRRRAHSSSSRIRQAKLFCAASDQLGGSPSGPNHLRSPSV